MCGWNTLPFAISWSHQRVMGLFVGACRLMVPLFSIWLSLIPVAVGTAMHGVVLLKLDRSLHDELRAIAAQMGVRLPRWL